MFITIPTTAAMNSFPSLRKRRKETQLMKNVSLPSVMSHSFSRVPEVKVPRSTFNRSCGHKTTFDGGKLIPIFVDEALPGDTFKLKMQAFARLATPIVPIMDNLYFETHWFFVPNRLVWDNWEKFNGQQDNPGDSTDFTVPQLSFPATTVVAPQDLANYMGVPALTAGADGFSVNAMPFRAYNLIFNTWYKDQNAINDVPVNKGDGPDSLSDYRS
jgi:hypothetical protein